MNETIDIEDDNRTENHEYTFIRGIFTYEVNDHKKYAFFILDWFYDTKRTDNLMGCKIYDLQELNNDLWLHVHSFHIVD